MSSETREWEEMQQEAGELHWGVRLEGFGRYIPK